ncbi:hypothetical protein N39L_37200 [Limnospira platensis NIES-39]|uniref:Uncharacterized protein n=1 Tax=Limnospira platensis NIES-46 TaxID=1236695 RepID=A0A5M3T7Z0_LIMPL|nr:hypothetical protein N39L_37200 [Arthrospira platensis NIES-39]GCE94977.1 hypothetical protein NIES46_30370 [Arthrospira platensis NIES-46]
MANQFMLTIPTDRTARRIFTLRILVYSYRSYVIDIHLSPISFDYDNDHIRWLCKTHKWLMPYFPLFDFL